MDELRQLIRKYAVKNAEEHGSARDSAVISKVLSVNPELKKEMKRLSAEVSAVVKEINSLDSKALEMAYSEYSEEFNAEYSEKLARTSSPRMTIDGAVEGAFRTRFSPEPSGHMHIGHAKAAFIERELANAYKGSMALYFDDTNPANERQEFVDAFKESLGWLGITYDEEYYASDSIEMEYRYAERMIEAGRAYVCTCSAEEMKEKRGAGLPCVHRNQGKETDIGLWREMLGKEFPENGASLRFLGEMASLNTALRDPVLFRIKAEEHYRQGSRYHVWPSYDFNTPIIDSVKGITHAIRSKEYELRDALYYDILDILGLRKPRIHEISRLEILGNITSKRKINELIKRGEIEGYDDPRLMTISGIRKRGILPMAVKEFVLKFGVSKVESRADAGLLLAMNRKLADGDAKRLFFVRNPARIDISGIKDIAVKLPLHPSADLGYREYRCGSVCYVDGSDMKGLKAGSAVRLKGAFNIKIVSIGGNGASAEYLGDEEIDAPRIQWVSEGNFYETELTEIGNLMDGESFNRESFRRVRGYAESYASGLKDGEVVQFERIGLFKFDKAEGTFFSL